MWFCIHFEGMKVIQNLLNWLAQHEQKSITWWHYLLLFVCIVLIRNLLESVFGIEHDLTSSSNLTSYWSDFILHHTFSFLAIGIMILLIMAPLIKQHPFTIAKVMLLFTPVIWIAPIFDFIHALLINLKQEDIAYIKNWDDWHLVLFRVFDPTVTIEGISMGQRFEFFVICICGVGYIALKSRSWWKPIIGLVGFILMVFFFGTLNLILVTLELDSSQYTLTSELAETQTRFAPIQSSLSKQLTHQSNVEHSVPPRLYNPYAKINLDQIRSTYVVSPLLNDFQMMALINYVVLLLLLALLFLIYARSQLRTMLAAFRFDIMGYSLVLFLFGLGCVYLFSEKPPWWLANSSYIIFFLYISILFFSTQAAVLIHSYFNFQDDKTKQLKGKSRVSILTPTQYLGMALLFLVGAIGLAFLVSTRLITLVVGAASFSALYSVPPFQWKRYFPISNMLLGLWAVVYCLTGMEFFLQDTIFETIPATIFICIFVVCTLGSILPSAKQYRENITKSNYTLATLFPKEQQGQLAVSISVLLAFLAFPLFLHLPFLVFAILSVVAASLIFLIFIKRYWFTWAYIVSFLYTILALGWFFIAS